MPNILRARIFGNKKIWRSSHQSCSVKKVLLEMLQNSQENTCARVSFFNKVAGLRHVTLSKKRLWHRCSPVNFAKFLTTPYFLTEHLQWLLLEDWTVLKECFAIDYSLSVCQIYRLQVFFVEFTWSNFL